MEWERAGNEDRGRTDLSHVSLSSEDDGLQSVISAGYLHDSPTKDTAT